MRPLLARPAAMAGALGVVGLLLIGSASLFLTRGVSVKMLPFDDKNELQIIVDFPEGTPLEATVAVASDVGRAVGSIAEVADVQLYAGVAAPFNFNGMIRHYYLRQGPNVADLQVNLVDKGDRKAESQQCRNRAPSIVRFESRPDSDQHDRTQQQPESFRADQVGRRGAESTCDRHGRGGPLDHPSHRREGAEKEAQVEPVAHDVG